MTTPCKIFLFNGLRVQQGEREITRFQTQKTGALLALLAYHANRSHPREMLIDMLWPDADINAGRHSLSMALSSLRHQLEPPGVAAGTVIQASRFVVQINAEAITTDVAEFEAALWAAGKAQSQTEQTHWLEQAVARYTGELLRGYYEDWVLTEQRRLADRWFEAAQTLAERWQASGDTTHAMDVMRRIVAADPTREEAHLFLMQLYNADGQPTSALRQYAELERTLEQQLGETPSPIARQLAAQISRHAVPSAVPDSVAPSLATDSPAVPPASGSPVPPAPNAPPTGTVTFLLTDIEGSTAQWEAAGDGFRAVLAAHHALLRQKFVRHQGWEVQESGDGFIVAFAAAADALHCAIACQNALAAQPLPHSGDGLRVRMALHVGDVTWQEGNYQGLTLHRAARLLTAAHGGQILASSAVATLLRRDLPADVHLRDLGCYRLRDIPTPERLFQADYPNAARSDFPAPRAEAGLTGNLPLTLTHFWGREKELGLLTAMLSPREEGEKGRKGERETRGQNDAGVGRQALGVNPQSQTSTPSTDPIQNPKSKIENSPNPSPVRLLTLTGPGGTGKTRLALEVGQRLMPRYAGAVWFAPLADLSDSDLIPDVILDALRIARARSVEPITQVVQALNTQPSLLILDNFEQLVEPGRDVVQSLLQQVPDLTILVTSRQLLELSSEREFVVLPLPTPQGARSPEQARLYESVQLFVDRAQAVRPDFQLTTFNAAAICEICDRLEGHPLALELAASRAQALSPAQMLTQLANRFHFLVTRKKDLAARHRTMRAAIDWSYELLSPELRQMFAQLAVFRGGFTLEAVETVCNEPLALDHLAQLRECSLIMAREEGAEMRFGMLETLREYAGERLTPEERVELSRRHADWCVALSDEAAPHLRGQEQEVWLARLNSEHDNLRAALAWTLDHDIQLNHRLAGSLWLFWASQGYFRVGRQHLRDSLAHSKSPTPARAEALFAAGSLAHPQADYDESLAAFSAALDIFRAEGNRKGMAQSLNGLGIVHSLQSQNEAAGDFYTRSLALFRELGYAKGIAAGLTNLGIVANQLGDHAGALDAYAQAAEQLRTMGDGLGLAACLNNLAQAARKVGEPVRARTAAEESLALRRRLGDKFGITLTLDTLADLVCDAGEYDAARVMCRETLEIQRELDDRHGASYALDRLAGVMQAQGEMHTAACLSAAAFGIRDALHVTLSPEEQAEVDALRELLRKALGTKAFQTAWESGRVMTWEQMLDDALASSAPSPQTGY